MKTYLVEIKVEVTHRVLVRAGSYENAEAKAIDKTEMPYDNYRLLTAEAELRKEIGPKEYLEIKQQNEIDWDNVPVWKSNN